MVKLITHSVMGYIAKRTTVYCTASGEVRVCPLQHNLPAFDRHDAFKILLKQKSWRYGSGTKTLDNYHAK